jgi:hypothetical protein
LGALNGTASKKREPRFNFEKAEEQLVKAIETGRKSL